MSDYRATGARREIPPWTKGVTMAEWRAKQPLCDGAEVRKWLADREAEQLRRELADRE